MKKIVLLLSALFIGAMLLSSCKSSNCPAYGQAASKVKTENPA